VNISEGNDVNELLYWLLGIRRDRENRTDEQISDDVRDAAARLADRSHKALGAGLTSRAVHAGWDRVEVGPWAESAVVEDVDTKGLT
jgi:hypothetical protein